MDEVILNPDQVENSTAQMEPDNSEQEIREAIKKEKMGPNIGNGPVISHRPVLPDKSCYCGPSAVNIGLGAANNNGENGWNNIQGGLNLAIASGNGNTGNGINSVNPNGCPVGVRDGAGNGNGGVNIGIVSGNNNGGHGWNVGNGGNNIESEPSNGFTFGGKGGHNVGTDSGNGNGGTNIGIIAGNANGENGWNVGNGGNNAGDDTFNHVAFAEPGPIEHGMSAKGQGPPNNNSPNNIGHGGNNVGDNSGNGNGGKNWGLWSGNSNAYHGWHTGNGGNNAGDNVGNGMVVFPEEEGEFVAHNSGIGGNNRGNNTGNGKGGTLGGYGSGQGNGMSSWSSGNGGNNVGDGSGNGGVISEKDPLAQKKQPSAGRKPWNWGIGVGNGGNNIGSSSGNGYGTVKQPVNGLVSAGLTDLINNFIPNNKNQQNEQGHKNDDSDGMDKTHVQTLIDEVEAQKKLRDDDNPGPVIDEPDTINDENELDKNDKTDIEETTIESRPTKIKLD